ncbi:ATP-binding cassette domain-containing protein [Frisingicoccus caecimuris]|uniref:Molybdate transport system ATP-binding protein n=1 Tax=Frisingicoccus caecimuris TaxID=1796636 RepID=A0A4R2LB67_9FIRM|nr:ATP-binding cassette domain-containing protein [Frisingicoccus caecimuris]MCR1919964.1 ATP-binding cassette domain-containing protein [Frisingicoccus caecimuris]TCO84690.1 molybdate transport system ATP-binding protein [Frisingicoccus caecimuris]
MSIEVLIKKDLGAFKLNIAFQSDSRRIGILGASGCGKSLTLKSIAGIERPDEGRIVVNGKTLFDSLERMNLKPQLRKVGYLFQNYALFPTMTVEQNIAAGLTGKRGEIMQRVGGIVEQFHLNGLEKRLPGELSGGQQQRVALARMLVCEPEVILLDEPFSALDVYLRDQMQRNLMEMLETYPGIVILVSHNRDEVYRMSEEMIVLKQGRLAGQGNTKWLFDEPGNITIARLTGCKNIAKVRPVDFGIYAEEWDMVLPIQGKAGMDIQAVAIRAHQFSMHKAEDKEGLVFSVLEPVVTEDLFEYNISFKTSIHASGRVDWKVSKDAWQYGRDKMPERLYLKKSDLHLLTE